MEIINLDSHDRHTLRLEKLLLSSSAQTWDLPSNLAAFIQSPEHTNIKEGVPGVES